MNPFSHVLGRYPVFLPLWHLIIMYFMYHVRCMASHLAAGFALQLPLSGHLLTAAPSFPRSLVPLFPC